MTLEETALAAGATESATTEAPAASESAPTGDNTPGTTEADPPKSPDVTDKEASEAAAKLAKRRQTFQERINEVTRQRHDAERQLKQAQARIAELEKSQRPDPASYTDQSAYDADQLEYVLAQAEKRQLERGARSAAEEVQAAERARLEAAAADFNERAAEYSKEVPGFNPDALAPIIAGKPSAQALASEILESEYGPQIAHYLSANPREAAMLAALTPQSVAKAIGRLEERFSSQPAPRQTKAPDPIKPIGGAAAKASKSLAEMTVAEYAEYVKRESARK